MMTLHDLRTALEERDIRLWREGTRLRYNAPSGALSDPLREAISARRAELLQELPELPGVPVTLSFAQSRIWFHEQLLPGAAAYHIPGAVRIVGRLDVEALKSSLQHVLARHDVLRTAFVGGAAEALGAVVSPEETPLPWRFEDMRARTHSDIQNLLMEEISRSFDLERPPLLRALLVQVADTEHILVVTLHHIASDGWSLSLLIQEISACYTSAISGEVAPLAPLTIQYEHFARRQRQMLSGPEREPLLAFWQGYLKDAPPALDLPLDRPRPGVETLDGREITLPLPAPLMKRLQHLSKENRCTLFVVLAAAFGVLLQRHTQRTDLVIGTAHSGRDALSDESLIGNFINTVPLRFDVVGGQRFLDLVAHCRERTFRAFEHATMPFEQIVEALQPPRDLSRAPVCQVMFNFLNQPKATIALPGCTLSALDLPNCTSKLDLTLAVEERDGTFSAAMEFRTSLFEEIRIRALLGQYLRILQCIAENPNVHVGEISLLDEREKAALASFNATARDVPPAECLHHAFESWALRQPEATAFTHRGKTITYRALNEEAQSIASHLQAAGVGPESIVAVFVPRGLHFPSAVFGILKAGGAYLPLDISLPTERIGRIVSDSGASVIVTLSGMIPLLGDTKLPVLAVDALPDAPRFHPPAALRPQHLAYLIYTSGSTGGPKGVEISHGAAVNLLHSLARTPGFTARDILLAAAPFSFDMSVPDLFLPTFAGGSTVILDREEALDGQRLNTIIAETGANGMQATSTAWRLLLAGGWKCPPGFRIFCGGEAFPAELGAELTKLDAEVWNLYGPTETTVWSAIHRVLPGDNPIPAGRPINNTQLHILDAAMQPVPTGVVGELCIGGAGLARGYRNRPEATARAFVPDPFASEPGKLLYRTGDLARFHFDGRLEILGRNDSQVKVRGHRIELPEIESTLESHPHVAKAVAIVHRDAMGEPAIVVFWENRPGQDLTGAEALAHLSVRLPAYMLPATLVPIDAWPVNTNGKLDRAALASLISDASNPTLEHCPPRNAEESAMVHLWSEVLKKTPSIHDNFFALGGHSLLALHLLNCMRTRFGSAVSLTAFLQEPTVEAVCRGLKAPRSGTSTAVRLSPHLDRAPFFFVPGASGNPFSYSALCRGLGTSCTFYGLQPPESADDPTRPVSIEQLAAHYVAAVSEIQPSGSIRLGGHSFGALVAWEMARLLHAAGREVSLLALVDMAPPHLLNDLFRPRTESEWLDDIADALSRFLGRPASVPAVPFKHLPIAEAKAAFLRTLMESSIIPHGSDIALVDVLLARYQSSQRAMARYEPHLAPCAVTLFRTTEPLEPSASEPALGWLPYSPLGLEEIIVPGDHITLVVEPHVSELADRLGALLTQSTRS